MGREASGALTSACGAYRYRLWRNWGDVACEGDVALWLMLNPSTADARQDDPTIRKCVGFARRWSCTGIEVVNLFALRSTDPAGLARVEDPVGPLNDEVLVERMAAASRVVCGWGAAAKVPAPLVAARVAKVQAYARELDVPLVCLGTTDAGQPRHPLMLAYATELEPWRGR